MPAQLMLPSFRHSGGRPLRRSYGCFGASSHCRPSPPDSQVLCSEHSLASWYIGYCCCCCFVCPAAMIRCMARLICGWQEPEAAFCMCYGLRSLCSLFLRTADQLRVIRLAQCSLDALAACQAVTHSNEALPSTTAECF